MINLDRIYAEMSTSMTAALASSRVKSNPKQIHQLRTSARRLETLLKVTRIEHAGARKTIEVIDELMRLLKKVQRAAGRVRDFDVQRAILSAVADETASRYREDNQEEILSDQKRLKKVLTHGRKRSVKRLVRKLEAIEAPLQSRLQRCERSLRRLEPVHTTPLSCAKRWMKAGARLDVMSSGDQLHDFRKETKGARYLAELQPDSSEAVRLAAELHSLLDAIGSWHDYEVLVDMAIQVNGQNNALVNALRRHKTSTWNRAVASTRSFVKRHAALLGKNGN